MLLAQNASFKNKAYHGTHFVVSRDRSFALIHVANRVLNTRHLSTTSQRRRFQVALLSGALASAADATATSSLMVRSLRRPIQKASRPQLTDSLFNTHRVIPVLSRVSSGYDARYQQVRNNIILLIEAVF